MIHMISYDFYLSPLVYSSWGTGEDDGLLADAVLPNELRINIAPAGNEPRTLGSEMPKWRPFPQVQI